MATPAVYKFTKIIPQIIPTDIIDVYDVIFNVQLPPINEPTIPPTSPHVVNKYNDWYCNNKLTIDLMYNTVDDKKKMYHILVLLREKGNKLRVY